MVSYQLYTRLNKLMLDFYRSLFVYAFKSKSLVQFDLDDQLTGRSQNK